MKTQFIVNLSLFIVSQAVIVACVLSFFDVL
jgi:hypothetical protein